MCAQRKARSPSLNLLFSLTLSGIAFGLLLLAAACGGGSSVSGSTEPPPSPPPVAVQFRIGDAPSDRLVSVEANINAIHLTDSNGNHINVLPATRRLEFTHLAGTSEPMALLNFPQGTYTSATIDGSSAHVSYLDVSGTLHEFQFNASDQMVVPISPPLTIGAQTTVVSVDFDVASFVTIDPVNNTNPILNNPVLTFTTAPVETSGQKPEEGALEHVVGVVSGVSGTSFTVAPGQNRVSLTFKTDNKTQFDNVTLNTLTNMIVKVNGATQADGSLLALEVEGIENVNGVETEGLIYWDYQGSMNEWLIPQDGNGAGLNNVPEQAFGQLVHLDLTNASFDVDLDNMDMTGLTGSHFVFDWTHVGAGQRVQVQSTTGILTPDPDGTDGLIAANRITLEKQSLSGTVNAYSPLPNGAAWFYLMLPSESYFTLLNPAVASVRVSQQAGTDLHGITSIKDGDVVRVRGLLFRDDKLANGTFNMVAQRISK